MGAATPRHGDARHRGRLASVLGSRSPSWSPRSVGGVLSGSFALARRRRATCSPTPRRSRSRSARALLAGAPRDRDGGRSAGSAPRSSPRSSTGLVVAAVGVLVLVEGVRRIARPARGRPGLMLAVGAARPGRPTPWALVLLQRRAPGVASTSAAPTSRCSATPSARSPSSSPRSSSLLTGLDAAPTAIASVVIALPDPAARRACCCATSPPSCWRRRPRGVDLDVVRDAHAAASTASSASTTCTRGPSRPGLPVLSAHVVVADDELDRAGTRPGARRPARLPRRALRRRALHVPARAGVARRRARAAP